MVKGVRIALVLLFVLIIGALSSRDARSCNSCGMECETACGTRQFKTCCFNYMRKRSADLLPLVPQMDLDHNQLLMATNQQQQRLEAMLARALKSPVYDRFFDMYSLTADDQLPREQGRVSGLDRSQ